MIYHKPISGVISDWQLTTGLIHGKCAIQYDYAEKLTLGQLMPAIPILNICQVCVVKIAEAEGGLYILV